MGAASVERVTLRRSFIFPDNITISARQVKHGEEENGKDSTRTSLSFVSALRACAKRKDLYQGIRIHGEIRNSGLLEKSIYLGNTLISMYAKCGALVRAQQVLQQLPVRNVISWNTLIAGHVQQGQGKEALSCLHRMQTDGLPPDAITYACILKACSIMQDVHMGKSIHDEIVNQGLLKNNVVLGTALVHMYAKCGALLKARKVFEQLPIRNVISWNALIAGYAQQGQGKEALSCFHCMQRDGLSPDAITYACILKACSITQDVDTGKRIHDQIASQGLLENDVVLGNALVDMYAKCGALLKAQKVFEQLPVRNVISWNTLIAGYAQQGQGKEALSFFHQMQRDGLSSDAITYACILKACSITQDVDMGKRIHDEIVSQGLLKNNVVLGTALVDMYAKCSALLKAQKVFEQLPVRNVGSWNALIAGYAQQGQGKEALSCFCCMQRDGLSPSAITYACILKACSITQDVDMGKRIHDEIVSQGLLKNDVVLGTALVDMYAKCGAPVKAQKVFEQLPVRNVISWSALIAGYAQRGQGKEALSCFHRMRKDGLSPDAITYACILKACSITQDVDMGKSIHDEIVSQGLLKNNVVLGTALIHMYAKCGALLKAQKVFEQLPTQNAISWNALIAGYAQQGQGKEALSCYHCMQRDGLSPDPITYACILKACSITQDVDTGKRIHDQIASQGLLVNDVVLGNVLVDMYAKCGALLKAQKVFEQLPVRNVISWNTLIAGYAQQGQAKEALSLFRQMQRDGLSSDAITYACILKACSITQDGDLGKRIHDEIVSQGLLKNSVVLGTALVDMYAKCGALLKAQKVFEQLPVRNVVTWSALIAGYAQQGQGKEALSCFHRMQSEGLCPDVVSWTSLVAGYAEQGQVQKALACFQQMQSEGVSPNASTFNIVLNACSHSGLVDEGQMYFNNMREKFGVAPNKEHYTCMVDLFGRARLFNKAMRVIKMMPSSDYPPVWSALLGACRKWVNVDLGRLAFEHVVRLDKCKAAPYVLMSNIYADAGMQEEAQNVECMRIKNAAWKQQGRRCLG